MQIFLTSGLLLLSAACFAQADYAREKRWADEITPGLVLGGALYLSQKSGHKFLAIYASPAQPRAAVIVVHGLGVHPDWALIGALRSGLTDQRYATLSVQMPVLAANARNEEYRALFPDAAERLQAAVDFLKATGHRKIALASHSMGSRMSNFFLTHKSDDDIAAWVSIGISSGEFTDAGKLRLPVLDIYGERDFALVLQNAGARTSALKKIKGSAQIEVAGADHYFAGNEGTLVKHIKQFLEQRIK